MDSMRKIYNAKNLVDLAARIREYGCIIAPRIRKIYSGRTEYALIEATNEIARLRERLQIDPGGSDKIDELEMCADFLRHRLRSTAQILIAELGAVGPMDAEDAAAKAVQTIRNLRDWQEGATAACWISYPPGMPPHTEDVYCAHKNHYTSGSEDYRLGADEVAAAIMSVKERIGQGRGGGGL
jgi:hypothetical protein